MSAKPSKQLESPSTTTSRNAESAAWIKAEIARAKEITARLEGIKHAAKSSFPSKMPSGNTIAVSSLNVFYYASPFDKVFLGTVDDSSKLVHFSLIVRDQLMQVDVQTSNTSNKSIQREVTIGYVDREAGLLVLKYINDSDICHPKPLTYDHLPSDSTLAFRCRVHHACNTFRVPHQLCGQAFRDRLCFDIRQLPTVTCADFQLVCDTVAHDAGLMNVIQNKVAYHTFRGWIAEHELACIWEYVIKCDELRGSNYVERISATFEKLQAEAAARGRVYKSGWCAVGVSPPAQQSGADAVLVMPTRFKSMAITTGEKTPVIPTNAAVQQTFSGPAMVVPTGPKNVTVATAEKAPLTSKGAAAHGDLVQQSVAVPSSGVLSDTRTMIKRTSVDDCVPADYLEYLRKDESESRSKFENVNEEITFARLSTGGPTLDLSSLPKHTPTPLTNKARPVPKLTLKTDTPPPSTSINKINWTATETKAATPRKPFGNVGGAVGAIKPAHGLSKVKGKVKEKVAFPEKKDGDEHKEVEDSKKGKGKENITPTESNASGSSGTPDKMSYAQIVGRY